MRVLQIIYDGNVIEFDIEVLVYALQGAADGDVVFELDGHGGVNQGFEKAARSCVNFVQTLETGVLAGRGNVPEEQHGLPEERSSHASRGR